MNFPTEAMADLPEEGRAMFLQTLEQMQVRDSLKQYNRLVERCFKECVTDFKSKNLDKEEEKCVKKCCEKFMNVTARTSIRFQEFFSEMERAAAAQQAQLAKGRR